MSLAALQALLASPPSEALWRDIVAEVERARGDAERWASFEAEALPYLRAALAAWPRELPRVAPLEWVERLCAAWDASDEDVALPDLGAFQGIEPFLGADVEARPAGHTPELALANTLELGGKLSGSPDIEPLDVLGHAYLRDCSDVANIREVRYEVEWHEYAASPLIAPEALWEVLSGPGWRGLERLSLGMLYHATLPIRLPSAVTLRSLTLIGNAYADEGPDPLVELRRLDGSPCLATVEVLGLARFEWSEALFELLLAQLRWQSLREVWVLGLAAHHLTDAGHDLAELVAWITAHPLTGPATLVLVTPQHFAADALRAVADAARPGWRVRIE